MNDDPDFDGGDDSRSLDRPNPVEEPTMEYVYAAMILHEADRDVTEENLTDVLDAAGVEVEEPRVKALVAALEDVDIDEAIETAAVPTAGAAPADTADEEEEAPEEEPEEEEEDEDEEEVSGQGLGDLFG